MREPNIEKAMENKYGQRLKEWSLSKGYHSKLQDGDTGVMVWYHTDGGITGRQWLETLYAWEEGNTDYMFDPDLERNKL